MFATLRHYHFCFSLIPRKVLIADACLDSFDRGYQEQCGTENWREHYYLDHHTKRCSLFWYDGCPGTSRNIFSSLETCETMCEMSNALARAGELVFLILRCLWKQHENMQNIAWKHHAKLVILKNNALKATMLSYFYLSFIHFFWGKESAWEMLKNILVSYWFILFLGKLVVPYRVMYPASPHHNSSFSWWSVNQRNPSIEFCSVIEGWSHTFWNDLLTISLLSNTRARLLSANVLHLQVSPAVFIRIHGS